MFGIKVEIAAQQHAATEYPRESCGLVIDNEYLPVANIHPDPLNNFEISPQVYLQAELTGKLQAVIHSHPDGKDYPTRQDMEGQITSNLPWGIIPHNKKLFFWGDGVPFVPLLGRKFRHGVTDCYSLLRDRFKMKKGIILPEIPRDWQWWDNGADLYRDGLKKYGFAILPDDEPLKVDDCLLGSILSRANTINHAAAYIGNGMIMHHMINRLSVRDPLTRWQKYLTLRVRYTG